MDKPCGSDRLIEFVVLLIVLSYIIIFSFSVLTRDNSVNYLNYMPTQQLRSKILLLLIPLLITLLYKLRLYVNSV